MTNLLDLCVTFDPPPADAPAGTIARFELRCPALGRQRVSGLLSDPLTDQERTDLRWYLEEYWQWPYEQFAVRGKSVERQMEIIGRRLYDALFNSADAQRIVQPWNLQPDTPRQISIEGELPAALSLPWELLHDGRGFLVLRARSPVTIVRGLPERDLPALPLPFTPPLRVLLVTARPEGAGFVNPRGIARELLDELEPQMAVGAVAVEFLRPPTLKHLRDRLSDVTQPPVHILHFDGHGAFQEQMSDDGLRLTGGMGRLAFEDDAGALDLVEAARLAQVLQDSGVKLAVLTACQSALGAEDDLFSSVAANLIKGGLDAVVAMSASVLVVSAARYVEAFYRHLAEGQPDPLAHERGRQALHDDPKRHPHQRTLDTEGTPVELRDWWLPHFYQQRPLALQPGKPKGKRKAAAAPNVQSLPQPPRYGFGGRAQELLWIERALLRGRLVVLQGFGGVGKTELAVEAARWLTRTQMYAGALVVSFEHGGDSALLLGELGRQLGIYDGAYNPNEPASALVKLRPALKQQPTLLLADNLESILPGGDAPLSAEERMKLWDTLLTLRDARCGVLLTTRDTNFGDGRLAPGERVRHLALGGLHPDDAYALAVRLLDSLAIERTRAPYLDLVSLLERLDHHPLAIQIVLPALHDTSLDTIRADFIRLLVTFVDDTATGRNRSLLASLDYSLKRLSNTQRALLPRLAPFESGASEESLLAITAIPEGEWVSLRVALEQAALLRTERVHEGITVPFLHFHPALAPYLRSQPGADDEALRDRYARRYHAVARYLYEQDDRNPQAVRALVRRELPNLRRALDLLLELGERDAAVEMVTCIARFLTIFGRSRELDELWRTVGQIGSMPAARTDGTPNTPGDGGLSYADHVREYNLGQAELSRGDLRAAYVRFSALLQRIEVLPEGTPRGRGSYEHCLTLLQLAQCLKQGGQPAAAEQQLQVALAVIEVLIGAQPDNRDYVRQRGNLLTSLGDVLTAQGNFSAARATYEEALEVDRQLGNVRSQGVVLGQLGSLALRQRDYPEAARRYTEALTLCRVLNEPAVEATFWHQLGMVAEAQRQWAEAERCYRESLAIEERLGNAAGAADTYTALGNVARSTGRPAEAEGWYRRALEHKDLPAPREATMRNNLALLLLEEVRVGRAPASHLAEARGYAERALTIKEQLDLSTEPWGTLHILAGIAELEGRVDEARAYRRRERESFAAFPGNRWHIDQQHEDLIAAIAKAARGNTQWRAAVERVLLLAEANGWHITEATHRIWAGERDWHVLVNDLHREPALLVKRVLEELGKD